MARYGYDHGAARLDMGGIISETLARIRDSRQTVLVYIVILGIAGAASDYLLEQRPGMGSGLRMGVAIGTIIATYLLIEDMLRRCGQLAGGVSRRYFPYLGQSIVVALGIGLGMVLLLVPGIIVGVRWSLAPALLIGRGEGAMSALGTSWRLTRGHGMAIFLALLVLMLLPLGVVIVGAAVGSVAGTGASMVGLAATNLGSSTLTVVTSALGVAVLRLLDPDTAEMEAVFA